MPHVKEPTKLTDQEFLIQFKTHHVMVENKVELQDTLEDYTMKSKSAWFAACGLTLPGKN